MFTIYEGDGFREYVFWCPGCEDNHAFIVRDDHKIRPNWTFNNDLNNPTFHPSLHYPGRRCHLFVQNGNIIYQADCVHKLAGKIVPLERNDREAVERNPNEPIISDSDDRN